MESLCYKTPSIFSREQIPIYKSSSILGIRCLMKVLKCIILPRLRPTVLPKCRSWWLDKTQHTTTPYLVKQTTHWNVEIHHGATFTAVCCERLWNIACKLDRRAQSWQRFPYRECGTRSSSRLAAKYWKREMGCECMWRGACVSSCMEALHVIRTCMHGKAYRYTCTHWDTTCKLEVQLFKSRVLLLYIICTIELVSQMQNFMALL